MQITLRLITFQLPSIKIIQYCTILSLLWAQDGYITGVIVSEDQTPIHGANIFSETLDIGTISQVDGRFTLSKVSQNKLSLTISMIGFKEVKNTIIMDGLSYDLGKVIMVKDTIKLNQIDVEAHHELRPHNFASNVEFYGKEYHENFIKAYDLFANYIDDETKVKKIDINTLILTGSDDPGSTSKMSRELNNDIPNSKFIEIKGGKHLCSIECSDDVNIAIKDHINNA